MEQKVVKKSTFSSQFWTSPQTWNIITLNPYSPYYVTRSSAFGSAVNWSCDLHTRQWYCTVIGWSSGDIIQKTICNDIINYIYLNAKSKSKNYNRSKPEILRLLWEIIVFRLVSFLLNMICLKLQLLHKIAYIWIFV